MLLKRKMELFQTVQTNLTLLGFIRNHGDCRNYSFNRRNVCATVIYIVGITSIFIFAVYSANSPEEYMDSFYLLAVLFTIFISFMTTNLKMTKLFNFFDSCEKIYNSKSKFYYIQMLKFILIFCYTI